MYKGIKFVKCLMALMFFILICTPLPTKISEAATPNEEMVPLKKWTGDYEGMVKRRIIRVLIPYSKTFFFFDKATPRGLSYDAAMGFEEYINKKLKSRHLKVHVLVVPTHRDQLLQRIKDGVGDIALGNLTITHERKAGVDFSCPALTGVSEVPVTSAKIPEIKSIDELSGREIYVIKSSSYYQSLLKLNKEFALKGKKPVKIVLADKHLEDEDLLEMVNAEIIPMVIVDNHKSRFWAKILDNIRIHPGAPLRENGNIAWAFRKKSPELKKVVDAFLKKNKKGSLTGNILFNRYLKNTGYITNSTNGEDLKRFKQMVGFFKKYGKEYDFNYLMLFALAYQESKLDNSVVSRAGAVGVMQILPSTALDKNVGISDFKKLAPNIHAGTKYLRFMENRYFTDDRISNFNRQLFSLAAYNAGPAKINKLRAEAARAGLDPNVWYNNVEIVVAKRIGRETVQYVSNIHKYYVAYQILADKM